MLNTDLLIIWFALAAVGITSGCAGTSPAASQAYVKPGLIMVPADQAHFYGIDSHAMPAPVPAGMAALDTRGVQTDAEVTAIQFNRYADPGCPDQLMHEAHIVYRRDTGPRWKLNPPTAAQQILIGPQITDGRGEIKALAAPELDPYLKEQRNTLHRQEETLAKLTSTLQQLAVEQKRLAEQVTKTQIAHREDTSSERPTRVTPIVPIPPEPIVPPREKTAAENEKEPSEIPER